MFRIVSIAAALFIVLGGEAPAEQIRVAVISDLNGGYGSTDYSSRVDGAIARIIELAPDLVLSTGDMIAGQRSSPKLTERELGEMWRSFHGKVTQPLREAGIPLAITPGNHDASRYPGYKLEREIYAREWDARLEVDMVDVGTFPFAYAFSVKDVLFISIDATAIGALPEAQMRWIESVLESSAGEYRAEIVFGHLPLWPFAAGRETEIVGDPAFAALLNRAGVDAYLSGHHHAYYPGLADGILFIAQSCLGGGARPLIGDDVTSKHSFTMIEVSDEGHIAVYALAAPDYRNRIDHSKLPERIVTRAATLVRNDLAGELQ